MIRTFQILCLFLVVKVYAWQRVETMTDFLLSSGDEADFYYPRRLPRKKSPGYPLVVVGQGGLTPKLQYSDFSTRLASYGYVVVVVDHYVTLEPGAPPQLFTDMSVPVSVQQDVELRLLSGESPLIDRVDATNVAVVGHSFGGANALYVAASNCAFPFCNPFVTPMYVPPIGLRAAVGFGTNLFDRFSGGLLDVDNLVPVALIQGSEDGIATPDKAEATMDVLESPKALITISGLNHWGIANENNPEGRSQDPNPSLVPQRWAVRLVARWTATYLDAYLKDDKWAFGRLRRREVVSTYLDDDDESRECRVSVDLFE